MKLIEKFMLKRCSTEVQVMLTRMKERPEDFDYGTGWRKLVDIADNCVFTQRELQVFNMMFVCGMSPSGSSRVIGVHRSRVGNIRDKIVAQLREEVDKRGLTLSDFYT